MASVRARGGLAVVALGSILVITTSWWALALWPVAADVPEWVLRTRAACFGMRPDGLPETSGWILLVGEPIGMFGFLWAVWREALIADLRRLRASLGGQFLIVAVLVLCTYGVGAATQRVRRARGAGEAALFTPAPFAGGASDARSDVAAPALALVDQHGAPFGLESLRGRPVMVTFAFAHCETVCPTIVHDLKIARRDAGASDAAIVVVTLDPWRDVPSRLSSMATQWQLERDDRVLSGAVEPVLHALDAWGVSHARDERTGEVSHGALVVLVDRNGRERHRLTGDWMRAGALLRAL